MGGANLGLPMAIGGMQASASLRAYPPTMAADSYWRGDQPQPPLGDVSASAYAKQSGLELEFSAIMGASASSDVATSGAGSMGTQAETTDVAMAAVLGPSFEVSSFGDHMNAGVVGPAKPGYHLSTSSSSSTSTAPLYPPRQEHRSDDPGGAEPMETSPSDGPVAPDAAGRLRRLSSGTSSIGSSSSSTTTNTVAAADPKRSSRRRSRGAGDDVFAPLVELDLRQRKLETKTDKCQFLNCPNRARVAQAYGMFCNRHVIVAPCGFPGCRDRALANASMCERHLSEGKDALHRVLATRAQNVQTCHTFGCFKNNQGRGYCRGHEKLFMATGDLPKHVNKRRLNSAYTMCSYPGCSKHSQRNHLCRTHGNLITKQAEELHSRRTAAASASAASTSESFEDILTRLQQDIRKCTQPTCTKNSQRDRLCTLHYYEKHGGTRDGQGSDASAAVATEDKREPPSASSSNSLATATAADNASADASNEAPRKANKTLACSVPECTRRAVALTGMCKFHANEGLKKSSSAGTGLRDVERTRCEVPGCTQMVYASGVCTQHLRQPQPPPQAQPQSQQQEQQAMPSSASGSAGVYPRFASVDDAFFSTSTGVYPSASMTSPDGMTYAAARPPVPSSVRADVSANIVDVKEALYAKPSEAGGAYSDSSSRTSACANPMCGRPTFTRGYCDTCQTMFTPLTGASVADAMLAGAGTGSYAYAASLSVDELTLRSREAKQQQLALQQQHHQQPQDAVGVPPTTPSSTGKARKYYCKSDGCAKQAQRKGYCKRHVREHEQQAAAAFGGPSPSGTSTPPPVPPLMAPCRFSGCPHFVSGATLCTAHAGASYCWQPGCENIVAVPQLCAAHAYRQQCAYEGCAYVADRATSGCAHHATERRCSHAQCDKFAVGAGDRCRLHQISCADEPCALCALRAAPSVHETALSRRPWPPPPPPRATSRRGDVENTQASGNR